ncbi:MAG: hypothetical protein C4575_01905 [Desulforudis sp.]|nr:MAG: hypothetical protein C4575_01905 [Desulforudis sp.]
MRQRFIIVPVCLIILMAVSGCNLQAVTQKSSCKTAELFLSAVTEGDLVKAQELSAGQVLFNLSQRKDVPKAKALRVKTRTAAWGKDWARIEGTIEMETPTGPDIGWYSLDLVNNDNDGWRVVHIADKLPDTQGVGKSLPQTTLNEIKETFTDYLKSLSGQYDDASKYLAGSALKGHQQNAQMFKAGPTIKEFHGMQTRALWTQDNLAVVEFSYRIDERKVCTIGTFWRTPTDQWKLVDIYQR